ncbi:hypothetical protein IWQ55_001348 [Labrenzia sp. EL_208]|nr:hypothetical protein [Labrenzia sp. EL_132]MBG6228150.1 hypothetical protein [Labrenzia sp. EL_208]
MRSLVFTVASTITILASTHVLQADEKGIVVFPIHEEIGKSAENLIKAIEDGEALFKAQFKPADGVGRPNATGDSKPTARHSQNPVFHRVSGPDANSCFGCHNQPSVGGAGDFVANVFVGAHFADPVLVSVDQRTTNERNTTDLFGIGAVEIAAKEMTEELHSLRDDAMELARRSAKPVRIKLQTKGVDFGVLIAHPNGYLDMKDVEGVDYALIVRPFGVKGVTSSIREFTVAALNQHHGIQAIERFGWERTGVNDFDGDGVENEFTFGHVSALVLFQANLPVPTRELPEASDALDLFVKIGCGECHKPVMRLNSNVFVEPNRYNRYGTLRSEADAILMEIDVSKDANGPFIVPFSDFKRHQMCDAEVNRLCNEELRQDNVDARFFITSRLWNLKNTFPYCHRGDCLTIEEAIIAHGGEARSARDRFIALDERNRTSLLSFLSALGNELK